MPLPDYGETLRPDFAVRELDPKDGIASWQLLIRVLENRAVPHARIAEIAARYRHDLGDGVADGYVSRALALGELLEESRAR